jgi:hypothetical protein
MPENIRSVEIVSDGFVPPFVDTSFREIIIF